MNLPNGKHHAVAVYAKQVVYGRLRDQCCPYEIKACERHLRDLERQGSDDFPYVFDCTRADRIYQAFAMARQCRGPMQGQPFELEPWQQFDLGSIYGWVHKATGFRRFNRSLNKRMRGTAKSSENAVKGLYHMTADCSYRPYHPEEAVFELSPEVECVAFDRDQARRVLDDAKMIAEISPSYAKRLKIPKSNPIVNYKRGGHMRALSKIVQTKNGLAPSYYCVDEYQEHVTSAFYDLGFNSFGKRNQSLLDCIMTAGDDADNSPAHREELYAKRILDGEQIDERYFVMIREVPDGIDPHDKSKWCWSNPMFRYGSQYAKTIYEQVLTEYNAAYGSGDPEKIRKFLSRRLCRWQTSSVASYLTEPQREQAQSLQVSREEFAKLVDGLPSWAGFDLAKRIDLTGAAMVTPLPDGRIAIAAHGFMPEEGVTRHEHTDRVPYAEWAKDGCVSVTSGAVTDNSYVHDWIKYREEIHSLELVNLGYDGHNAVDLALAINTERGNDDFCVEIRQTCAGQTFAVKTLREMIMQGRIVFEQSPLLMWCLKNAVIFENYYGDVRISKKHKDDSQRVDPLAAVIDALSLALLGNAEADLSRAAASADYEM